ncbi:prephenate dehydrogenase/arogenate dehydrogenase family protein [Xanthomonas sp. A2111]|uniref:chorismate mutase n=1 Tax=Xanthomonas hawaiiensis TaxID=3003247 RepID=A0ABU2IAI4_9XANT|nr:chorismate mutase [Xanthomonas sp. A2111]MBO9830636.1 prephenate dehydrogenase/arogenate dehydrogenase family protein [Xanthomonas sp. A2111]MDS9995159.1 prephenate dehydrogenase/arogenate dehydrogenase family protein [Xanthomonas sp. A2111]
MSFEEEIAEARKMLDAIDQQLIELLQKRFGRCLAVGELKRRYDRPVMQPSRVKEVTERAAIAGAAHGMSPEFCRRVWQLIIDEACRIEYEILETEEHGAVRDEPRALDSIHKKTSTSQSLKNAVVVGTGAVGGMLAAMLSRHSVDVACFDASARPGVEAGDACAPNSTLRDALERADAIVLALPERALSLALPIIDSIARADCLIVETASVKQPLEMALEHGMGHRDILGINPMFAPSVGAHGQSVAVVRKRRSAAGDAFLALIENEGAHTVSLDAARHDCMTAAMQSMSHAAIISFSSALKHTGENLEMLLTIAPPPFRVLVALMARILGQSRETYWGIQMRNPRAADARERLRNSFAEFDALVVTEDPAAFMGELDAIERYFGNAGARLRDECAKLFAALPSRPAH